MDGGGQFDGDLDRPVVGNGGELQFRHDGSLPPYGSSTRSRLTMTRTGKPGRMVSVGCTSSWRRTICWPASVDGVLRTFTNGFCDVALSSLEPAPCRCRAAWKAPRPGRADPNDSRRHPRDRKSPARPRPADAPARSSAVGHDEPVPDEQHTRLAEGDLAVVLADEARALRDEEVRAGRAVIDILRHLRGDLAGQIGADAGDERRRDDGAGLQDIGRGLLGETIGLTVRRSGSALTKASLRSCAFWAARIERRRLCRERQADRRGLDRQDRRFSFRAPVVASARLGCRRTAGVRAASISARRRCSSGSARGVRMSGT